MDAIISFFTFLQGLGVSVMMPIIITIIGCCLGAGFGKSLKAGLMVGVGFIGLNLVINQLFGTSIGPAVQEMIHRFGLQLSTIDVGWPAAPQLPWAPRLASSSSRWRSSSTSSWCSRTSRRP